MPKSIDHVAVVGAGAIGSLFGALLSKVVPVTLLCRQAHAHAVLRSGLSVTGAAEFTVRLHVDTRPDAVATADLVLLTTKAFAVQQALAAVGPHLKSGAVVVLMQNGLGIEDAARQALPSVPVLRGLTYHGVTFPEPGHIIWAAKGRTVLGDPSGASTDALQEAVALFREAGIETEASDQIQRDVWAKALGNIGINALGAITGMRNGEIAEIAHTRAVMVRLVQEAEAVARAQGYAVDAHQQVVDLARATGRNKNSMLQDVEAGHWTEIEFLNGAIVRMAEGAGVAVPYNECITELIRALEPDG